MNPFDLPIPGGDAEMRSGQGICDFCLPPQPAPWIYPCKTFVLPGAPQAFGRTMRSEGDWGACVTCADLIENNDRKGLVARCGHRRPEIIGMHRKIINRFFENRINEPRKYVGEGMDEADGHLYPHMVVIVEEEK
jgi:hypothetical protein